MTWLHYLSSWACPMKCNMTLFAGVVSPRKTKGCWGPYSGFYQNTRGAKLGCITVFLFDSSVSNYVCAECQVFIPVGRWPRWVTNVCQENEVSCTGCIFFHSIWLGYTCYWDFFFPLDVEISWFFGVTTDVNWW